MVSRYRSHSNISRRVRESTKHCFSKRKEEKGRKQKRKQNNIRKIFYVFYIFPYRPTLQKYEIFKNEFRALYFAIVEVTVKEKSEIWDIALSLVLIIV